MPSSPSRARRARAIRLAVIAAAIVGATPASATPLRFTFSGGIVGSFVVDSTPRSNSIAPFFLGTYSNGTGVFSNNVGAPGANIGFVSSDFPSAAPGVIGQAFVNGGGLLNMYGPVALFDGPGTAPVFRPGSYAATSALIGGTAFTVTLATPGAPAPELGASWAAALAAAFALVLTRKRAAAA